VTFKPLLILSLILSGGAIPAHAGCLLTKAGVLPMTISGTRLYVPVTMNDTPGSGRSWMAPTRHAPVSA
jgi:hypothetical protein